jgi:DNA primase
MFDAKQFCEDYNINIPDRTENTQEGWVNIQCPCCADRSNHGGFHISGAYYYCWKCGWHSLTEVIQELINCSKYQVKDIIAEYTTYTQEKKKKKKHVSKLKFPPETCPMQKQHKKYLESRGFDVDELEREWNLMGTGIVGNYSHRILAPILYRNKIVSYQTRDITGQANLRYKACVEENEVIHHRHIVYGIDKVRDGVGIIVEGMPDTWRIGPGAVALFGTSYTTQQINFLINHLQRAHILFDFGEKEAQAKAQKLANALCSFMEVEILEIPGKIGDPGQLEKKEVEYLRKIIF